MDRSAGVLAFFSCKLILLALYGGFVIVSWGSPTPKPQNQEPQNPKPKPHNLKP